MMVKDDTTATAQEQDCAILYVDDEEKSLKYFRRAFEKRFRLFTANSAEAGLEILAREGDEIGVLLTDQRMPGKSGVDLLQEARVSSPNAVRILVTAYAGMDSAIAAVNAGKIFHFIEKPWDLDELGEVLTSAMRIHVEQRQQAELLHRKLGDLRRLILTDQLKSLVRFAAGINHHTRNALVPIKCFIDLIPQKLKDADLEVGDLDSPSYWVELYQHAQDGITRITQLTHALNEAVHVAPMALDDRVSVRAVLDDLLARKQSQLTGRNIVIDCAFEDNLPPIAIAYDCCYRLFELFVDDAVVGLPNGTQIRISATLRDEQPRFLDVALSDNGGLVPERDVESLFFPFSVRNQNPEALGLNFTTCYLLVHYIGGRVSVRNNSNGGVTFVFSLPVDGVDNYRLPAEGLTEALIDMLDERKEGESATSIAAL